MNLGPISSFCLLIGIIGGIIFLVAGFCKVLQVYKNKFNFSIFPYTFCMLTSLTLFGAASEQTGGLQILMIAIALAIYIYTLYFDIKKTTFYYGIVAFILQICMIFMLIFILLLGLFSRFKNYLERKLGIRSLFRFFK